MLYWCPANTIYDNWSKGSPSLLDRGAVRYKMAHNSGAQPAREARAWAEPHSWGNVVIYPYQKIW